jgi:hypothetical protein
MPPAGRVCVVRRDAWPQSWRKVRRETTAFRSPPAIDFVGAAGATNGVNEGDTHLSVDAYADSCGNRSTSLLRSPSAPARIDPMTALRQNKLERSTGQPAKVRNTSHDPV